MTRGGRRLLLDIRRGARNTALASNIQEVARAIFDVLHAIAALVSNIAVMLMLVCADVWRPVQLSRGHP